MPFVRTLRIFVLSSFATAFAFAVPSCSADADFAREAQSVYVPLVAERTVVYDSIELQAPRPLCNYEAFFPGERYDYGLVPGEGYHVFSKDTSETTPVAFLQVPGSTTLSQAGSFLLIDVYSDILRLRVDIPGGVVSVSSGLQNGLLPTNSFPVQPSELVRGFDLRDVTITQDSDGAVLAAWRCADCTELILRDNSGPSSTTPRVSTTERLATVAFVDLRAFVADGSRLMNYQAIGESFVRLAESRTGVAVGRLTNVGGVVLAYSDAVVSYLDQATLTLHAFEDEVRPCDQVASDGQLFVTLAAASEPCSGGRAQAATVFEIAPSGGQAQALGTLTATGASYVAVYDNIIFLAEDSAIRIVTRDPAQSTTFVGREAGRVSLDAAIRSLSIAPLPTPMLSVATDFGVERYEILRDGELALTSRLQKPLDCPK